MTCQGCAGSGGAGITKPLGLKTFSPSLCLSLPLFPFFTLFLFLSLLSLHLLLILKMKNACPFLYTVALDQGSQPLHNYCWQSNHSLMGVGGGVLLCFVESSAPLSHSDTSPHISKCPCRGCTAQTENYKSMLLMFTCYSSLILVRIFKFYSVLFISTGYSRYFN